MLKILKCLYTVNFFEDEDLAHQITIRFHHTITNSSETHSCMKSLLYSLKNLCFGIGCYTCHCVLHSKTPHSLASTVDTYPSKCVKCVSEKCKIMCIC